MSSATNPSKENLGPTNFAPNVDISIQPHGSQLQDLPGQDGGKSEIGPGDLLKDETGTDGNDKNIFCNFILTT